MSRSLRRTTAVASTLDDFSRSNEPSSSQEVKTFPQSPTKVSRLNEKKELSNLNDRLACYIDKVRNLENENNLLTREVKSSEENHARELACVKSLYDSELSEARKLLDELSREKAEIQVDARRLFIENEELKVGLEKKNEEFNSLQTAFSVCESNLSDIDAKYNKAQTERKRLTDDNLLIKSEKHKLAGQLANVKKHLEEETLQRVHSENKLQTLKEDIIFKEQLFEQQLMETRTRKQAEISEIDGKLMQEYEEKLYLNLHDIRHQYETDLQSIKQETKKLYEEKIRTLEGQVVRHSKAAVMTFDEMKNLQENIDVLKTKITSLEEEQNETSLIKRNLEAALERTKTQHLEICRQKEDEITILRDEMDKRNEEYQDLMDIKIALDLEITAYRKLLEGEEERLNISSARSSVCRLPCQAPSTKRKRIFHEESEETHLSTYSCTSSSKCDISIFEVSGDGKFIKLINKTNREVELGGWQLINRVLESSTIYKFNHNFKLVPGASVTVWSPDFPDVLHQPPENLVMKGSSWHVADLTTSVLTNPLGEEMAIYEQKKIQLSDRKYYKETEGNFSKKKSHMPVHRGNGTEEEKCALM